MAGVVCCCVVPMSGSGPPLRIVPVPLCRLHFPSVCVLPCLLWVGKCGGGAVYRSTLLFSLCVHCHSIVDYVVGFSVRVVSLWNGGGAMASGVLFSVLCSLSSPLPLPLCVGVRGSARAAQRARTLSPNTIVFPLLLASPSLLPSLPFFITSPFLLLWNGGRCDSPCVTVLCWHDGNREPVSFVFVFLVVACSSFSSSSVAASAVAFGA